VVVRRYIIFTQLRGSRVMKTVRALWKWLENVKPGTLFVLILLLGFAVRLLGVFFSRQYQDLERYELERVAISLATTGVFGNPYAIPTGPTGHVSPGYPLILAALFRLFGTGIPAEMIKQTLACAVTALECAMLPYLARRLFIDPRAGLLAGIYTALLPFKFSTQTMGDWETPITALVLMLAATMTVRIWKDKDLTTRYALACGLTWGVSLLFVSAVLFLFVAFVIVGIWFVGRPRLLPYARFCMLEIIVAALCITPWAIRNYSSLGSPIITRTNVGLELRLSNNDLAGPNEHFNFLNGVHNVYHPLQNRHEAMKVRKLGEVEYNKEAIAEAKEWIKTHPKRFLQLTLGRIRWFWLYTDFEHPLKSLNFYVARLLGFLGLVYLFRSQLISAAVLAMILFVFPLPNYVVHVGLRHSFPIDWILTLLTMAQLVRWYDLVQAYLLPAKNHQATPKMEHVPSEL